MFTLQGFKNGVNRAIANAAKAMINSDDGINLIFSTIESSSNGNITVIDMEKDKISGYTMINEVLVYQENWNDVLKNILGEQIGGLVFSKMGNDGIDLFLEGLKVKGITEAMVTVSSGNSEVEYYVKNQLGGQNNVKMTREQIMSHFEVFLKENGSAMFD